MRKYILLIPIFGIFAPYFIKDWRKFVEENSLLFNIALIVQIFSFSFFTFFCAEKFVL